jgi:hypothetical protein
MSDLNACVSCAAPMKSRKQCGRCGTPYCSATCQKAHWKTHKSSCQFKVLLLTPTTSTDPLSLLRTMPDPGANLQLPTSTLVASHAGNAFDQTDLLFGNSSKSNTVADHIAADNLSQHDHLVCSLLPRHHFDPSPLTHTSRYTKPNGEGSQLLPSTGDVPSGVTLGHFADMLAAQSNKAEYHWMQPHGYSSWLRSADSTTPLPQRGDKENSDGFRGVYVNPSNGIAFPGGFGRDWRKPGY